MFYYEQITPIGRWTPRTEPSEPTAKSPSGQRRKIRNVQRVPSEMQSFDLESLSAFFNAKRWIKVPSAGQFRGQGEWETIEDVGCSLEDWEYNRQTGYLPVHFGEAPPVEESAQ